MSMVSLLAGTLMNARIASNSEYAWQNASQGIMNGVRQASNPNLSFGGLRALHDRENNLQSQMILANVRRQAANAQEDSYRKMLKDNIRKSFSVFA